MISPFCRNISKVKNKQNPLYALKIKDSYIAQARPALILVFEREIALEIGLLTYGFVFLKINFA